MDIDKTQLLYRNLDFENYLFLHETLSLFASMGFDNVSRNGKKIEALINKDAGGKWMIGSDKEIDSLVKALQTRLQLDDIELDFYIKETIEALEENALQISKLLHLNISFIDKLKEL